MQSAVRRRAVTATVKHYYNSTDFDGDDLAQQMKHELQHDEERNDKSKHSSRRSYCGWNPSWLDMVAVIAVSLGMLLVNITEWTVVYVHSLFTAIFGLYASYQQRRLKHLGSLRKLQNELRQETNELMEENVNLHLHVNELNDNVYQVQKVELDLQRIGRSSQGNIRRLVNISRAQQDINEKIKTRLRAKVVQNIMAIVLKSDRDGDLKLSPREVESLIIRLGMMDGVAFDEVRFRQYLTPAPTMDILMGLFRLILNEEEDEEDTIFQLNPLQLNL